ncbi:MAG: hypothetical protein QXM55_03280 [Ignisphaera sp.]
MPPTDSMKKLSRSDLLSQKFSEFLRIQGILREGNEMFFANTLPFTSILPYISGDLTKLYHCMPLSLCLQSKNVNIENAYSTHISNAIISCREKLTYTMLGNDVYIYDVVNKVIGVFFGTKINRVKVLNTLFKCSTINLLDRISKLYGVYSASFYDEKGVVLSVASAEPIVIDFINLQSMNIYVPKSALLLVSTNKLYTKLFRDVNVYSNIVSVKGSLRNTQALVEILDPISLVSAVDFDSGCVEIELINPENLDFNAIIKVYGYIDELTIDDLIKFKPVHNMVRIAMSMYSRSKLRLCISTYVPWRSDAFLRLKDFEQVS